MGPPLGALPPMRMTASWPPVPTGSTEYKVAADAPQRDGELPSIRIGQACGFLKQDRDPCLSQLVNVTVTIPGGEDAPTSSRRPTDDPSRTSDATPGSV